VQQNPLFVQMLCNIVDLFECQQKYMVSRSITRKLVASCFTRWVSKTDDIQEVTGIHHAKAKASREKIHTMTF
jgi:hypothetical protein